jgi:predicted nucleic acid-binding Zn ribbon protein
MVCPKCGKPVEEGALVCRSCGTSTEGLKKDPKRTMKIAVACGVFLIFMICFVFLFGGKNHTVTPYEVDWGSTYETIALKDTEVGETALSEETGTTVCSSAHDGAFLGFAKEDVAVTVQYDLGTDNALASVTEEAAIQTGGGMDDARFVSILTERYNNLYGAATAPNTWQSGDTAITLENVSAGAFHIVMTPVAG